MAEYVLGIDQSTQGTKALLFDSSGNPVCRTDLPHRQLINDKGWVEHNPEEIYNNVIQVVKNVVEIAGIKKDEISAVGISNQRETSLVWDRAGKPIYNAIVWQDARASALCELIGKDSFDTVVAQKTGIRLSPYFPAGKLAWILQNANGAAKKAADGKLLMGTVDTWLVYRLTGGRVYQTDYSNASRTQLFNIHTLSWDVEICNAFGIDTMLLADVIDSDGDYGKTDFEGFFSHPIPIRAVLGDSHSALFGQGCTEAGMLKATYGTGSSVMMNVGASLISSGSGLVTSLAWKINGKVNYVLEGNINYAGAVITWLKDDLGLITSDVESETLARQASTKDNTFLVPAFTGLGAPYWDNGATAMLCGMTRTTKKAELVRAALDGIAYQITDVIRAMEADTNMKINALCVDGGPTGNGYLMQFQSNITGIPVQVSPIQELSAMGATYAAGAAIGLYDTNKLFKQMRRKEYLPQMDTQTAAEKYAHWKQAVQLVLQNQKGE